jgi:hypothetical protein
MTASDRCSDVRTSDACPVDLLTHASLKPTDGLLATKVRLVCISRSYSPEIRVQLD